MSPASICDIAVWVDSINVPQDLPLIPPIVPYPVNDKENARPVNKGRIMQADSDQTPRPQKRVRDLDGAPSFSPHPSPTKSASSAAISETSELESHQSGRLSPIKQLQLLEDFEEQPVIFSNFDDDEDGEEPEDVIAIRTAIQRFADGIGILGYDNIDAVVAALPSMDRMRCQYPWANDLDHRCVFGSMPSTEKVLEIVEKAREYDHGSGAPEDDWNSRIQEPLLNLACSTSKHQRTLDIHNVKTARIEPASLARSALPGRVVDYVVALKPDPGIKEAWRRIHPLPDVFVKSWNHTTRVRHNPIAINIETKGPMKSWTDGKPQIAIWIDAWLKRLALFRGTGKGPWPAFPLLIAQGHDWHLLIVSKNDQKMIIYEQINIGSTRSCFDAMKVVAVLHWLMDWAERVWRPWLLSLFD